VKWCPRRSSPSCRGGARAVARRMPTRMPPEFPFGFFQSFWFIRFGVYGKMVFIRKADRVLASPPTSMLKAPLRIKEHVPQPQHGASSRSACAATPWMSRLSPGPRPEGGIPETISAKPAMGRVSWMHSRFPLVLEIRIPARDRGNLFPPSYSPSIAPGSPLPPPTRPKAGELIKPFDSGRPLIIVLFLISLFKPHIVDFVINYLLLLQSTNPSHPP